MDDGEQSTQTFEDTPAVRLVFRVRMLDEETHVAEELSQAKLHQNAEVIHVFSVSGKIVAAQDAVKFFAEHLHKNVGATRFVDLEQREKRGAETPGPHLLLVVLVAGLIDVEAWLVGQAIGEGLMGILPTGAGLGDEFGEIAATDLDGEHVTDEFADGGIRTMASAFEISDQRGEPSTEEAGAACGFVEGRVVDLFALATPARMGAKANDRNHFTRQGQFDLLNDFGRLLAGNDRSVAVRAFDAMKIGILNLVIGKERPLVTRMAWLPAAFSFLAVLWLVFGLLDDVAGGGLRRVGGVLLGSREFRLQLRNAGVKWFKPLLQLGASCARLRPCDVHNAIG